MPSTEDWKRLRVVGKRLNARELLLASWRKGSAVRFFRYEQETPGKLRWVEVSDLHAVFR